MASLKMVCGLSFDGDKSPVVPGPKYSSLQMGNDPRGQRIFMNFINVRVMDGHGP